MQLQKNLFILSSCIGLCLLAACKKNNHEPPPPPAIPMVKNAAAGPDIRSYTYDNKGRVIRIDLALYGKETYAYTDTGIVVNGYDLSDSNTYKEVIKLGANGLATSYTSPIVFSDLITYSYNSNGQMTLSNDLRILPGQDTRNWASVSSYTGDNLDSVITTMTTGGNWSGGSALYYDSYFTDQTNTLGNDNYGKSYLGKSSKNPVKDARDIGHDNSGFYPATNYTYLYDSLGRITQSQEHEGNSNFSAITYTYY